MTGQLRQRGDAALRRLLEATASRPVVWRSMAFLYVVAALIVVATLLSGVDEDADEVVIVPWLRLRWASAWCWQRARVTSPNPPLSGRWCSAS